MIPHNPLQTLYDLDRTSPRFHEQLTDFLRGNEYPNIVTGLQSGDLAWLVEYLDSVLYGIPDPDGILFRESLHELRRVCSVKEVLPKSYELSDYLLGCVYEGTFDGSKVRIRRVRIHPKADPQAVNETFRQVAVVWKHLTHPNIVPLLGVTANPLQLISDWMPGRDLTEYITNHPDADRLSLLSDVAEGLNYLHSYDVIHGDLKGSNVLVDASGHARLVDFGLAVVTRDVESLWNAPDEYEYSPRWIAPEILEDRGTHSKEADVFSFAMVTIEAFTSSIPFSNKSPRAAMLAIIGGERPPRPTHPAFTDRLWVLTQKCWDQEAHLRPPALRISCGFGTPAWKRLANRPLAMDERISLVTELFSNSDEIETVKHLGRDDAQPFVDVLDEVLSNLSSQEHHPDQALDCLVPWLRRECLASLRRVCSDQALLPKSVQIPLCYNRMDTPLYCCGFAEVWKGEHRGRGVAVKVLKVPKTSNLVKITRRFCGEVVSWKALHHQNVLSLLGATIGYCQFTMVSEWVINGNINEFIKAHREANRFELLKDVVRGLSYLHGQGVIHGNLKGANILIGNDDRARLADFGFITIFSDYTNPTTSSSSNGTGVTRWTSPELLDPERFGSGDSQPTIESDCYALGMVVLEVLTGQLPFPLYSGIGVIRKVIDGECPGRPQGPEAVWFTDGLWGTLEQCWSLRPEMRPTIEVLFECLEQGSTVWQPLSPCEDNENRADGDDESVSSPRLVSFPSFSRNPSNQLHPGIPSPIPPGPLPPPPPSHLHSHPSPNNVSSPPPTPSTTTAPPGPGGGGGSNTRRSNTGASTFFPKRITIKTQDGREVDLGAWRRKDAPASPVVEYTTTSIHQTHQKRTSVIRMETFEAQAKRLSEEKEKEPNNVRAANVFNNQASKDQGAGLEPVAPLEFPANRWTRKSPADKEQNVEKQVRSLLNELTMEKFDAISDQIIEWANKSEAEKNGRTLIHVIRLVCEKATHEAAWSEMYARLCRKMMETISPNVQDDGIRNAKGKPITGGQLFRKYLLNRCQEDFERGWAAKDAAAKASEDAAVKKAAEAPGEIELYSDEYYAAQKARRQGLGLIQFIGELYKLQMLTERIMHECIKKFLGSVDNPEEEEIESLCRLLATVGKLLDNPKARAHMDIYFTRMKELGKSNDVAPRMQLMLQDLIELRERKWIPRNQVAAPTTIAQVYEEAAKQRAQAEKEAANRTLTMSRGGSRRGGERGGGPPGEQQADGWSVAG